MNYNQLAKKISKLTPEQLKQSVTIFDRDTEEYHPVKEVKVTNCTDVLDRDHFIIVY